MIKHVLLKNPRLKGLAYGVLRALEDEIVLQTGATVLEVPYYGLEGVTSKVGHGMRWDFVRNSLPKKSFTVEADVIWYILMGPENYELDLFKDWDIKAKYRIVYLFDTLEVQFLLIRKLFVDSKFNICITSFHDAIPILETVTGQKWYAIEQAVPTSFPSQVKREAKVIDFSSYGRRIDSFHNLMMEFCQGNGLYYDYSTYGGSHPTASEEELYLQYAWHISHSMFTISWPVELTSPAKAGRLKPVTCRWFEGASTGTVILGKRPDNAIFDELLVPDLIVEIDPFEEKKLIWSRLEQLYADRDYFLEKANRIKEENFYRWTWKERVVRMLQLINKYNKDNLR